MKKKLNNFEKCWDFTLKLYTYILSGKTDFWFLKTFSFETTWIVTKLEKVKIG